MFPSPFEEESKLPNWICEVKEILPLEPGWRLIARQRLKEQTRPEGSLGLLESFIERLVAIQKKERPEIERKRILIFAADHGVSEEGVSLYPREVTKAMVRNFLNGGATINALARYIQAEVCILDVGVDADFEADPRLLSAKARGGTRNMTREPAMSLEELDRALNAGWDVVRKAKEEDVQILALGEMGIGNTTAASAVVAALTEQDPESVTGRGTGLDEAGLLHKIEVIKRALQLHEGFLKDPLRVLQCVGGYEIAAMTGAVLAAARFQIPAVIDGWIVSAAALAASRLNARVLDYLFFAHQSAERGHRLLLKMLEVEPILNLSMRLGEASGAALALSILEAGIRIYNEVSTFAEAGVANRQSRE